MQGKKTFTPQLFYNLSLASMVPADDFYRQVNKAIDFRFLRKATAHYYGTEGNESIDPIVFFKICMVGYLNNISSDRFLVRFCDDSLSVRLFIGYNLDEQLPWHSTISRTRKLYGEEVFLSLFKQVLRLCVEKGMVSGKRQAMDSAFIKANASMESLLEKEVLDDVEKYVRELAENSDRDDEHTVTVKKKKEIEQRQRSQEKRTKDIPGSDSKNAKLLSNATHYSPTDPDARISTKPGKSRDLHFIGQLSVDTAHHVITGACADFANKRDSQSLEKLCEHTIENLREHEIEIGEILADTGYSSGEVLTYLTEKKLEYWIPNFGQFTPEREGFIYNNELNQYECQRGNRAILPFKNARTDKKGYTRHCYRSSESVCRKCEHKSECCGEKTKFKKIERSEHYDLYMKNHEKRVKNENYAKRMSRLRSSTVEPVLGTLLNFRALRKTNTRGIAGAGKHIIMAALCYNLKKMLKFKPKETESAAVVRTPKPDTLEETLLEVFSAPIKAILSQITPIFAN
jgi:transposase